MSLAVLVASASLLVSPVSGQYSATIAQHQKPPIYAQAPQSAEARDENLEHRLAIYRNLIFSMDRVGKRSIEMAWSFYNEVIKESQNNSHLAEAYYNSGYILCCLTEQKDVREGLRRLDKAYEFGNQDTKEKVLNLKFRMAMDYELLSEKYPNLKSPGYYVREMRRFNSELAEKLSKELKRSRDSQKVK
ncbi:MAG: hypothetical protein Q8R04_04685 [Nanoarchaeota archaeon]|nr:hypothetical protein [Nanoarchaeota archaeon]